jgi:uncharacterized protein (TIGR02246 family)
LGFTVALVSLTACAAPAATKAAPDAVAIRAELNTTITGALKTLNAKDVATLTALFTDDGTWILPDASTAVGKPAIEALAKAFFTSYDSWSVKSDSIDTLIILSDSEAVTFSHQLYTLTLKGKTTELQNNPFMDYWRKTAGGWKIVYELNATGPAPKAAEPKKP